MMTQLSSQSSSMLLLLVAIVSIATIVSVAQAQSDIQEWLDAHNTIRQAVGANILDLVWSDAAYNYALLYAQQQSGQCLPLMHSPSPRPYGENLAWNFDITATATWAVNDWAAEAQYYDYGSNSCMGGEVCGHYTQVVWAASTSVGCATVACADSSYPSSLYFICSYNPPGNIGGQQPY